MRLPPLRSTRTDTLFPYTTRFRSRAIKAAVELARNPLKESFTYPGNRRRIFIALFGIAAGLTVIWYTAMFSGLSFLKGPMKVEDTAAEIIVGAAAAIGMVFFIIAG